MTGEQTRQQGAAGGRPPVMAASAASAAAGRIAAAPPVGRTVAAGLVVLALFFGGFGGWAALAPLAGAAIAPGAVRVEGQRKTVQHLEGGIIAALPVAEGDEVREGQILVRLDRTRAEAEYAASRHRYLSLLAAQARLIAERDGQERVAFPPELTAGPRWVERTAPDVPDVAAALREIVADQEQIFATRRRTLRGHLDILRQRIAQLGSQITGLRAQIASGDRQLALIAEEADDVGSLLSKGLAKKSRLLELQRHAALLEGGRAEHGAQIARAEQAIGETELQILSLEDRYAAETAASLRDVQAQRVETANALRMAEDALRRREVRAPVAGRVVRLRFFTAGGVIEPGAPILDIVPAGGRLVVEARVSPLDIDVVRPDLPAEVRLSAFRQRAVPPLEGRVLRISADRLVDERTGAPYYAAEVAIDEGALARAGDGVALYPGMPAEVMIVTDRRTLWEYLFTPLTESFARSFRES